MLSQPACELCDRAKTVLERLGREFALHVSEVALDSTDGQRLAAAGGVLFAPGVLLDGQAFSYGRLSERKLRKELRRRDVAATALTDATT